LLDKYILSSLEMTLAQSEYDEELRLGEQTKVVSLPVG
jgi:hypothetical protein